MGREDDGPAAEVAQLRAALEQQEEREDEIMREAERSRGELDETRRQLLLVVAQRDALHAAMRDVKEGMKRQGTHSTSEIGTLERQNIQLRTEVAGHLTTIEQLSSENLTLNHTIGELGCATKEVEGQVDTCAELLRMLTNGVIGDVPSLAQAVPPAPAAGSGLLEKSGNLLRHVQFSQRLFNALQDKLAHSQAENTSLRQHISDFKQKAVEQANLLSGYHALHQKSPSDVGEKARGSRACEDAGRVEALEQELRILREENVQLIERDVALAAHGEGTALHALRLELAKTRAKLREKSDSARSLKSLLRQHLQAGPPPAVVAPPSLSPQFFKAPAISISGLTGVTVSSVGGKLRDHSPLRLRSSTGAKLSRLVGL